MKRRAGNAGAFYPANCGEIEMMIERWNGVRPADDNAEALSSEVRPLSIISPHAGYIYSGFTANIAHRLLGNTKPKRVVVIGPSHHVYFEDISISLQESFETPCGDMPIDSAYARSLGEHFGLGFVEQAHGIEHSTETQMPFIKHYNPYAKVVEIIYGNASYTRLSLIIDHILSDPDNAVVISSDLSHFYTLQRAKQLDSICLEGIERLDISILDHGCEACGIIGIKAMIESAQKLSLASKLLDYRTSADASGDTGRVVGYMSAVFV